MTVDQYSLPMTLVSNLRLKSRQRAELTAAYPAMAEHAGRVMARWLRRALGGEGYLSGQMTVSVYEHASGRWYVRGEVPARVSPGFAAAHRSPPQPAPMRPSPIPYEVQKIRELEAAGRLCQGRVIPDSWNDGGKCNVPGTERRHPDTGEPLGRYCIRHYRKVHPDLTALEARRRDEASRERRATIDRLKHDEGLSTVAIAERMGITPSRVTQVLTDIKWRRRRFERRTSHGSPPESLSDGLSQRTYNCLKRSQITTPEQVRAMTDDELLCLRLFGAASLREVRAAFGPYDPTSRDWCPNWVGEAVPA